MQGSIKIGIIVEDSKEFRESVLKLDQIFCESTKEIVRGYFYSRKIDAAESMNRAYNLSINARSSDDPSDRKAAKIKSKEIAGRRGRKEIDDYNNALDAAEKRFVEGYEKILASSKKSYFEEILELALICAEGVDAFSYDQRDKLMKDGFRSLLESIHDSFRFMKKGKIISEINGNVKGNIIEILEGLGERKDYIDPNVVKGFEMVLTTLKGIVKIKNASYEELKQKIRELENDLREANKTLYLEQNARSAAETNVEKLRREILQKNVLIQSANKTINAAKELEEERANSRKKEEELENLRLLKSEFELKGITSEDGKFWESMYAELEIEQEDLKEKNRELNAALQRQSTRLEQLERMVEELSANNRIIAGRIKCELDLDNCSADDLLSYITYSDCNIHTKQACTEIILKFFSYFMQMTSKGSSSSTNIQSSTNKGKGGGNYANNFLNPMINFLRQVEKQGSQFFLEKITNLDWKSLIEEYAGKENVMHAASKKERIIAMVYSSIVKEESIPLFQALNNLADYLESINKGDVDLSILADNIREASSNKLVVKELRSLVKFEIDSKK